MVPELEVHRVANFSTYHIPQDDARKLNAAVTAGASSFIVDNYGYGWRVFLGTTTVWSAAVAWCSTRR